MPLCICESIQDLFRIQIPVQKVEVLIVSPSESSLMLRSSRGNTEQWGLRAYFHLYFSSSHMCATDVQEEVAKDRKTFSKKLPVAY